MTEEKLEKLLEFGRTLEEDLVVVTKDQSRTFIDFNDEDYDDTHILHILLHIIKILHLIPNTTFLTSN